MITRRAALWALGLIFAANFLNYMDRQLVSALERPLRRSFGWREDPHPSAVHQPSSPAPAATEQTHPWWSFFIPRSGYGALWTLFTLGYMLFAGPIGNLADRGHRPRLLAICITVWSVATMASGLAGAVRSPMLLYISRFLIGVGEAGCLIIGPALISDLFAAHERGRKLSIFYLGLPLGGTAAFIFAGLLLQPVGWQSLFYLAGAPGFLVAALIWVLPDPPRGGSEAGSHGHSQASLGQYVALLKNRTLLLIIVAQAFAVIILIPLIHFGVAFFEDSRGMGERQARLALGVMALVAGSLGSLVSGRIGDRLARRTAGAYALLAAVGYLAAWPCLLVGFLFESRWVFLPALTLGCFFIFMCMPAVNTQIANVVSPAQRAMAWALAVFILHLLGDTLSPLVFDQIIAYLRRQDAFLYFSTALILAGVCCLVAARTARADTARFAHLAEPEPAAKANDAADPDSPSPLEGPSGVIEEPKAASE
jgi:MFS family permease